MTRDELKQFEDQIVVLHLSDGERLKAKLMFVDLEYEDVIVAVLETNQPQHYKYPKTVYTVQNATIQSVDVCEPEPDDSSKG
jgi:hypothetical protein